jgi:hypothetical protein
MPKVYGSYKTGADIYKDRATGRYYIIEWSHTTQKTYKKFVSFKISDNSKTIKTSRPGKTRKLRKDKIIGKQQLGGESGVPGQMESSECKTQVLNTESYKTILAQLNLADPQTVFKDIQNIRERYTQKFMGKRLVDVIYDSLSPGIKTNPKMCWDHGIDNPKSITGGLSGIHVYVADTGSVGMSKWKLVGVFVQN